MPALLVIFPYHCHGHSLFWTEMTWDSIQLCPYNPIIRYKKSTLFRVQLENNCLYEVGFLQCLRQIRDAAHPVLKLCAMDMLLYSWPYLSCPMSKPTEIYRLCFWQKPFSSNLSRSVRATSSPAMAPALFEELCPFSSQKRNFSGIAAWLQTGGNAQGQLHP